MKSRRIEDLHPLLKDKARTFLERADQILGEYQAFITDGFRDAEEQDKLYAQGRTTPGKIVSMARAGESPHNYGLAIDIAFRRDGVNEAIWDRKLYEKLITLAKELGLEWGGSWTGFVDNPHYELIGWRQIAKNDNVTVTPKETVMSNTYKGLDLNNVDSMKVAVDTWKDVTDGKYIKKEVFDAQLQVEKSKFDDQLRDRLSNLNEYYIGRLASVLETGQNQSFEDLIKIVKELKTSKNFEKSENGTTQETLLTSNNNNNLTEFAKDWYLSKTVWFNIIMSIIGISSFVISLSSQLPEEVTLLFVMIQGAGNILLRTWFTTQALK